MSFDTTLSTTPGTNVLNTTNTPTHADMHIKGWPVVDHTIGGGDQGAYTGE
jgi:hypothetical protein